MAVYDHVREGDGLIFGQEECTPEKILSTPMSRGVHGNGNSHGNRIPMETGVAFGLLIGMGMGIYDEDGNGMCVKKKFRFAQQHAVTCR